MSNVLQISNLSKSFGGKKVLNNVNISLPQASTHVLLGSSGSGKSTLIRIVLNLIQADSGTFNLAGGAIGYVPQDGGLFPHLTARQNISLVAETQSWNRKKITRRMLELESLVSLESGLLDRYPKELSGGQRQRVSLMRAAFLDPVLLLLDEPLGALDPLIRVTLQNELKEIFKALKKSVLLVTHDLDEARFFGDELTLLHESEVIQQGTYDDLLNHPASAFVTQFIRSQRRWAN